MPVKKSRAQTQWESGSAGTEWAQPEPFPLAAPAAPRDRTCGLVSAQAPAAAGAAHSWPLAAHLAWPCTKKCCSESPKSAGRDGWPLRWDLEVTRCALRAIEHLSGRFAKEQNSWWGALPARERSVRWGRPKLLQLQRVLPALDEPSPPPSFYQSTEKWRSNLLAEDTRGTQACAGTQGGSAGAPGLTRALRGSAGVCHELPQDQFEPEAPLGLGWREPRASQGGLQLPLGQRCRAGTRPGAWAAPTLHRDKQPKTIVQPWVQPWD